MNVVLLPGLDGTGELFERFERAAPRFESIRRVVLPRDRVLSYDDLAENVLRTLPPAPFLLIGESFSGPLALRLTRHVQPAAVVLCASFLRARALSRFSAAHLSFLLRLRPPTPIVRALLTGGDATLADDLVRAVASVEKRVIASRVRMVLEVDAIADLAAFRGPVLYLRATRDRLVGRTQASRVREVRPDVTVAEIEGPHLLLQARPDECWDEITRMMFEARLSS